MSDIPVSKETNKRNIRTRKENSYQTQDLDIWFQPALKSLTRSHKLLYVALGARELARCLPPLPRMVGQGFSL